MLSLVSLFATAPSLPETVDDKFIIYCNSNANRFDANKDKKKEENIFTHTFKKLKISMIFSGLIRMLSPVNMQLISVKKYQGEFQKN